VRRGRTDEALNIGGFYIRAAQPKPKVRRAAPTALCALAGLAHLPLAWAKNGHAKNMRPGTVKREAFLIDSRSWEAGKRGRVTRI